MDAWNYQTPKAMEVLSVRRATTWGIKEGVEVHEVFVGTLSVKEVLEFGSWLGERFEEDQRVYLTGTLACSIQETKETEKDMMKWATVHARDMY